MPGLNLKNHTNPAFPFQSYRAAAQAGKVPLDNSVSSLHLVPFGKYTVRLWRSSLWLPVHLARCLGF